MFKKTNAFVDGKVKPNVERFKEHMKAKQEKIVESPVVTNLLTRADSVIDTIVPPDSKEEMAGMQQPNGTPSNVERAKNLTSKVAHRIQKRYVRVRSYSSDSVVRLVRLLLLFYIILKNQIHSSGLIFVTIFVLSALPTRT